MNWKFVKYGIEVIGFDHRGNEVNKPWLTKAINAGDDIELATLPHIRLELYNRQAGVYKISTFRKELKFLISNNYKPSNINNYEWQTIKEWVLPEIL